MTGFEPESSGCEGNHSTTVPQSLAIHHEKCNMKKNNENSVMNPYS